MSALVASPLAAGLFHRAISMSAPAGLSLPTVAQIAPKRAEFAAKLGCRDEATQPACLRRPTAQQILDAAEEGWEFWRTQVCRGPPRWTALSCRPMAQRLPSGELQPGTGDGT